MKLLTGNSNKPLSKNIAKYLKNKPTSSVSIDVKLVLCAAVE